MSINDYEFFNGVVLNKLIRKGKPVKIDIFPSSSNNAFTINDKIGLYIKYSKKLVSPWRFGFQREHQDEFQTSFCRENEVVSLVWAFGPQFE